MTTSHTTRRILFAVMLAAIAIGVPVAAQRVSETELLLREALHKQQVQGDLPGAIKIYQQIVSVRNGNRAVTARALLELAGCYEKLGQQAETVYQQIVRDFGDQPVAARARARLAALRPPTAAPAMTLRKLETNEAVLMVLATDGQRAVFVGPPRTLYYGDLSGRDKRFLRDQTPGGRLVVARDLSAVLVGQGPASGRGGYLSIIKTDGSGQRDLDLHQGGKPFTISPPGPFSMTWSWDNRYVLLAIPDKDGSRVVRITVADGTVSDVLPGSRGATQAQMSPDGQFIAYKQDLIMGGPIYVAPTSGGESELIATDTALVDWTRDGRHLVMGGGQRPLSAVPIRNGRKAGELVQLRSVPGPQVRMMANGTLLVLPTLDVPPRDTWVGVLDDRSSSIKWTVMNLVGPPIPSTFTAWAADGIRFAYVMSESPQTRVVRVKNIVTGDDRELYRGALIIGCVAAQHEDLLFCAQADGDDTKIVSVAFESRRVENRGALKGQRIVDHLTADDRKIVFYAGETNSWVEWDISTGEESPVPFYRSADARWSLNLSIDSGGRMDMRIRPATRDGDWRFLANRIVPPQGFTAVPVRFSPDGNWLVYHDRDSNGRDGLYRIASTGGEPQRLGDYPTSVPTSALSISRDGRRFIVHAPPPRRLPTSADNLEYWVLENFLPSASAAAAPSARKAGK